MKALSIFWALYILFLSLVPCQDGGGHTPLELSSEEVHHTHDEHPNGGQDDCTDLCTPLCSCQCCGTFFTGSEIDRSDIQLDKPVEALPEYVGLNGSPFFRPILQPPRT